MSLRTRLLAGLAVLVLVAVSSSGWLVLQVARARLADAQETNARLVAEQLLRLVGESYDPSLPLDDARNQAALHGTARALVERADVRELAIVDAQGRALVGEPDAALRRTVGSTTSVARRGGSMIVYAPLGGARGAVRMRLSGDDALSRALDRARLLLVAVTLFDGVLVVLLGALAIGRVVRPLEALAQVARRVGAGELDVEPVSGARGGDEIGRLIEDVNRMTASLKRQREHMVAQERLVTVGRLAAGVAHEVGNPLAAVLGYVDLLLDDEQATPETRRDLLQRVRKETDRIRGIVADLLDYSRPVAGAVEPVRLREVADAALSLVSLQPRFRGIAVDNQVPAELPPAAASASRMTQVLLNLLLNAADAAGPRGRVTLRGTVIDGDGGGLELSVSDSGPGVPAADRARVFDPFFTTKEPGQGTGLGLAISRAIAEAYGGQLTLSPDGPGATFVIKLRRFES
jgi:signal transduction histidine kinase